MNAGQSSRLSAGGKELGMPASGVEAALGGLPSGAATGAVADEARTVTLRGWLAAQRRAKGCTSDRRLSRSWPSGVTV